MNHKPMLNAYPDSLGGNLGDIVTLLKTEAMQDVFSSFYILPSVFNTDLDRGFSVIDYTLNEELADKKDLEALEELGINIPVCGMVKDDNHRTRGVYFNNIEIPIDTSGEGFHLVTRIQDEAHRFAIEYHRSLRSKEQVHSVLDDIPGIGETRRKALMRRFRSVENIRDASVEELSQTESMNVQSAEAVYQFFHRAPNHTNA